MSSQKSDSLAQDNLKQIMWIGEQSRSIANHYSGMRLTITGLNFAAMGAMFGYASSKCADTNSIAYLLIYSGVIFGILSLKMSSAHAFSWGVYEKCRNSVIPDDDDFIKQFKKVENDYDCKFKINCWFMLCWATRLEHRVFWPLVNFLIPALPAALIFFFERNA